MNVHPVECSRDADCPCRRGAALKKVIPVLLVVGLAGALLVVAQRQQAGVRELEKLRQENAQLASLQRENEELKKLKTQVDEVDRLRKDAEEAPRLRAEVRQLRQDRQQLQQLQAQVQQLQAIAQQTRQVEAENAQLRNQNQQIQGVVTAAQTTAAANACINNLRQLDGGKEQWALERRKTIGALPRDAELFGERAYIRTKPVCPQGGIYNLGAIGTKPTCSIPGHALP